ncbi:MAG TPA: glycosyltransferase [Stellaceae bacterium]|jgi:glycosyltransferase involved in cell wall biosynthesis|nr:glycosyltransferase [Stellaceae bacterium]
MDKKPRYRRARSRPTTPPREIAPLVSVGGAPPRKRLLCFIVAYNAEKTIEAVLTRIPASIADEYYTEILVIDDASRDRTFECGRQVVLDGRISLPLTILYNPVNQGYGGNQKIGYHFAIKHGFDYVALIHGDGQYAPECLPDLVRPLREGTAEASFGSRMMVPGTALKAGMPLYKYIGNKILTAIENRLLHTTLSEFHSGYRVYAVDALRRIPFHRNSNGFCFDTEIIIQLVLAGARIAETPIPTYYGDEICHVNGLKYALDVTKAAVAARLHALGLVYDRRFDDDRHPVAEPRYVAKLDYESPHSIALEVVPVGARVLDLGCAGGHVGAVLERDKRCQVTGVDCEPPAAGGGLTRFVRHDLNRALPATLMRDHDCVMMLDVIEHLLKPEQFVEDLYRGLEGSPAVTVMVSTGNVGFVATRLMLFFGKFNYGRRGILDLSHTRLFTFGTLRRLFEQGGFDIVSLRGVPAPFPLALGTRRLGRWLLRLNNILIRVSRGLFSYQMFMVVRARPSLDSLLADSQQQARLRAASPRPREAEPLAEPAGWLAAVGR